MTKETAPVRRSRRRRLASVALAIIVLVSAGAVLWVIDPFASSTPSNASASPLSLATVARQNLSSQTELSGTLGYVGSYTVVDQSGGSGGAGASGGSSTFTWLPAIGQSVDEAQPLYDIDGSPVVLLYGSTPAYRSLSETMTGADVAQLDADLVALGYATASEIPAGSDEFTWWTKYAVEKLQFALGVTESGTLSFGQIVFLPSPARVTSLTAVLGGAAQVGAAVLAATSTTRQVNVALDASDQAEVKVGDKVSVTLPNTQSTPGVISSVGTVATTPTSTTPSSSSTPTITVSVMLTDPRAAGSWAAAPVDVTITTATVRDALVVPVDALLALSNDRYAVEVVAPGAVHKLVPVTLGTFDDALGLVQITSSGLSVGAKVVVPTL